MRSNRSRWSDSLVLSLVLLLGWIGTRRAAFSNETPGTDKPSRQPTVVIVIGAAGTEEYAAMFQTWADHWTKAAERAGAKSFRIGGEGSEGGSDDDRTELFGQLDALNVASDTPVWLVLIGHGTFRRDIANFNLAGKDVSSAELAKRLDRYKRPLAIVNLASASAPFINALSGPNRVIVTATKSGTEQNFARLGEFFSEAIASAEADLDHDDATSLLEAFVKATREVDAFYRRNGRIATEHALIDDNGDALGTPAKAFNGIQAIRSAKGEQEPDGDLASRWTLAPKSAQLPFTAAERERRATIENQIQSLRRSKESLVGEEYWSQLKALLLQQAELYATAEARQESDDD
ncbi:MAG: hypothetical protein AAGA03_13960 [Planctomycetota bacterium]